MDRRGPHTGGDSPTTTARREARRAMLDLLGLLESGDLTDQEVQAAFAGIDVLMPFFGTDEMRERREQLSARYVWF